jgi:hypothetical protein
VSSSGAGIVVDGPTTGWVVDNNVTASGYGIQVTVEVS